MGITDKLSHAADQIKDKGHDAVEKVAGKFEDHGSHSGGASTNPDSDRKSATWKEGASTGATATGGEWGAERASTPARMATSATPATRGNPGIEDDEDDHGALQTPPPRNANQDPTGKVEPGRRGTAF
jgi:hypothetical protein